MDARQKAILRVACALICSESRKKRKKKRVWVKEWLDAPGPGGLSVLRKEVEVKRDIFSYSRILLSVEKSRHVVF